MSNLQQSQQRQFFQPPPSQAVSPSSFSYGNAFLLNGRLYQPFSDFKNPATPSSSGLAGTLVPLNYRPGTIIKTIGMGMSSGNEASWQLVFVQGGAGGTQTINDFSQPIPMSSNVRGTTNGGWQSAMLTGLELIIDGSQTIQVQFISSLTASLPWMVVNGWQPI